MNELGSREKLLIHALPAPPCCPVQKTVLTDRIRRLFFFHAQEVPLLQFIANRLRELRQKHGLTQEQMAVLLKTDLRWYQRVEFGQKDIRATTIDRLGAVFGISGAEFLAQRSPKTKVVAKIHPAPHRPRRANNKATKPKR